MEHLGTTVATPDFLLVGDVHINGFPVRWIEVKSFYGASLRFPQIHIEKQVQRYITHWGTGKEYSSTHTIMLT